MTDCWWQTQSSLQIWSPLHPFVYLLLTHSAILFNGDQSCSEKIEERAAVRRRGSPGKSTWQKQEPASGCSERDQIGGMGSMTHMIIKGWKHFLTNPIIASARCKSTFLPVIKLRADHHKGWAAGAQQGVLNRLFWSKPTTAGRCWCGGTLLPYKPEETIHSLPPLWAAEALIQLLVKPNLGSPRRPDSLSFKSPS